MKVAWSWLKELVDVAAAPDEVAARLTFAGVTVDAVTRIGEQFSNVVVAEVLERGPHPRAQKLTLVTVGDGAGRHQVVCGAANVPPPGGKVLWARPGARLPGGREIGTRELQGVASAGMICSETELEMGDAGEGIVVLTGEDAHAAPGAAAQDALGLRDTVLELDLTANRGDCLSHLGVAREVAALYGLRARRPDAALDAFLGDRNVETLARVAIDDEEGCPRYVARVVDGLTAVRSPRWMRRRLEAVGVRTKNILVDVTNYVMFELGQPLHAFDHDRLVESRISVRRARAGERMTTLDGQERPLEPSDLVICDGRGPVALAGVMGGAGSEVSDATSRVLLESAHFDPKTVRRTAKRVGLHSESSHRFERSVDPDGADLASARAARLLAELGGGRVARGAVDVYPRPARPRVIDLRPARVAHVLGVTVPADDVVQHLRALELGVEAEDQSLLKVTVPTVRADLEREIDLIDEVARMHGFERVPATLPVTKVGPAASGDPLVERVKDLLVAAGLDEAVTFGFTSPARLAALRFPAEHPVMRPLLLDNPMREEQRAMRTSLLANLLFALARCQSFGVEDVRMFEVGSVFLPVPGQPLPLEPRFVAGVLAGARPAWLAAAQPIDFYDAKGVVERLFAGLRLPVEFVPARSEDGFLHPGVAAGVLCRGEHLGIVGEVHPETRDRAGIEKRCFAFELNLERFPALPVAQFKPITGFPAIVRDVSFFVDESVPAARVAAAVDDARPQFLEELRVLEDYREPGKVPPGKKGMLWTLTYRAPDRTLTDVEVDAVHEPLVRRLISVLSAERR